MANASKTGSAVYQALPGDFRQFWMYRAFVGEALKMLKHKGMTGEQVLEILFNTYVEIWYTKAEIKQAEQMEHRKIAGPIKQGKTIKINIRWKEHNEVNRLSNFGIVPFPPAQWAGGR